MSRFALLVLAAALLSACLFEPGNEFVVADSKAPVTFSGETGARGTRVRLQAASDPAGPFTTFATVFAGVGGRFDVRRVIPGALWRPVCGGALETFLRADAGSDAFLITFDDASVSGETGRACVAREFADGNPVAAASACASDSSPVVRVSTRPLGPGEVEIIGDVVVDAPADFAPLACVERIDGSLTIDDGVVADEALPALVEVTGDVSIVYRRPPGTFSTAEHVDLPSLTTVGGSLLLTSPPPGEIVSITFGMPALVSLAGDLVIDVQSFNATPIGGLPALAEIGGSLSHAAGSSDSTGTGLLPALHTVHGDVVAEFGNSTTQNFYQALEHVDGDVEIVNGGWIPDSVFDSLASVGGDLRIRQVLVFPFPDPTALGALVSVGGTFDVEELSSPLEFLGGAAISVGGLRLDALDDLVDLDVAAAKLAIAPTGPITITDNPNLPQCDALDWVAALPGYTGTATVTGNQPCP